MRNFYSNFFFTFLRTIFVKEGICELGGRKITSPVIHRPYRNIIKI